jgi:group I intron endonuclease
MKNSSGFVYQILNLVNGKFYVGSTINTTARWRTHLRKLRRGNHHCPHLQAAWVKYGEESFSFNVIKTCAVADVNKLEQEFLDQHHGSEHCYNLAKYVDNSNRGIQLQDSHKKAISTALKDYFRLNGSFNTGRKHSEEAKALMSKNRSGIPVSPEKKEKLRVANLGKKYGEETRKKLSLLRKGKQKSEEHIAKYNKAIIEVTTGEVFPSLKVVKERFAMSPGQLSKALKRDQPLQKGKNSGKHFRYLDSSPNP